VLNKKSVDDANLNEWLEHLPTLTESSSPFCAKIKHVLSNRLKKNIYKLCNHFEVSLNFDPRSHVCFHSLMTELASITYHRYIVECGATLVDWLSSTPSEWGRWLSTQHTCRFPTFQTNKNCKSICALSS